MKKLIVMIVAAAAVAWAVFAETVANVRGAQREKSNLVDIYYDIDAADGGTRCASITGGMVALQDAIAKLLSDGTLAENPIVHRVAAVSVGVCDGTPTLDLDYAHDSTAEVDLNVVMTDDGRYVELQGTAEHNPFTEKSLDALRALARKDLKRIFALM